MSVNSMNVAELYRLYNYISEQLNENENTDYLVYEPAVIDLYDKMLNGEVNRKDFLIFAIGDMLDYIKTNNIEGIKSTAILRFNRIYKQQ